jgi:L-ascorbate metabolism protein UlaG (beta-lactamase superfamily)
VVLKLVRSATLLVDYGGVTVLVDPMLADPHALPPVEHTAPPSRNPLVELPQPAMELLSAARLLLVTHLHFDHVPAAQSLIDPATPILCQPADGAALAEKGFTELLPVESSIAIDGITVTRVPARHSLGQHELELGPCSGFVLKSPDEPVLHIAGDCVWCPELAAVIDEHRPAVIVLNAGAARFLDGAPISMTAEDVIAAARRAPYATLVAVHLEALNHCPMSRDELHRHLVAAGLDERVRIPRDGEALRSASRRGPGISPGPSDTA